MTNLFISVITQCDTDLMLFLNGFHNEFWDRIMFVATNKWLWIPFSFLLAAVVIRRSGVRRGLLCIACIGLAVALSDQLCATLLRPMVERLRPSNPHNPLSDYIHIVNNYRGGMFGFPSCHASTTMSIAVFLSLYFRRKALTLFFMAWSLMMCYTRIYLGVHYPTDILCGLMIGAAFGYLTFLLYRRLCAIKRPMLT